MKIALGFKAHSGWAVVVVVGMSGDEFQVIDRRRIELVETEDASWAKQPYHAAEDLEPKAARDLVKRGIEGARRIAIREMRAAIKQTHELKHEIAACAVLVPSAMPNWSTDEILAVHFRMHKAEGVLFPEALARAADKCGLRLVTVEEKRLDEYASNDLMTKIGSLGKSVGPPWGKDQKNATLAAIIALQKHQMI